MLRASIEKLILVELPRRAPPPTGEGWIHPCFLLLISQSPLPTSHFLTNHPVSAPASHHKTQQRGHSDQLLIPIRNSDITSKKQSITSLNFSDPGPAQPPGLKRPTVLAYMIYPYLYQITKYHVSTAPGSIKVNSLQSFCNCAI